MKLLHMQKQVFVEEKFYCIILEKNGKQPTVEVVITANTQKKKLKRKMML